MTTRNRYSSAPTYGMLKKPAPKKQAAPKAPFFGPNGQGPFAPQQMPPPGYGPAGTMQPQVQGYAQQQPGGFVPPQPSSFGPSQPAHFTPSQPVGYSPSQMMYSTPAASYAPQPGFNPGQPGFAPQQAQQATMPAQPVFYPPQQTYPIPPMPQEYGARLKSRSRDSWLQICLLGVLPVLFILTLFIAAPFLKWAFMILAVLSLGAMWYKRSFVSSARTTLSLVYGALILVCAVSLITGAATKDLAASSQGGTKNGSNPGLLASGASPSTTPQNALAVGNNANSSGQTAEVTPPPTTVSGEDSEAWIRLEQFFNYWMLGKQSDMLSLVLPSWASQQENPANSLFQVRGNRKPEDYTFEKISGSETDTSRTVTMTSVINKNNGRDPVKIRFQVLMQKVQGQWYVDPNTLASNDEVKETDQTANAESGDGEEGDSGQSQSTATPKATATPGPKTKLYYNKEGGTYYHIDKNCTSVNKKYLPLTNFNYQDLSKATFKKLVACPVCHAPERP